MGERVLALVMGLQVENRELRKENERLKCELEDVFALSQMVIDNSLVAAPAELAVVAESPPEMALSTGADDFAERDRPPDSASRPPQKSRSAGRATLIAYETLGADESNCSATLKQRYRAE